MSSMMSVGDMALAYGLRRQNAQLKTQMQQLSQEVTTGIASDLGNKVGGDFMSLASIERSLKTLDSYDTVTTEAQLYTETAQTALGKVYELASGVAPLLISSVTNSSSTSQMTVSQDARQKLDATISALNLQVAGRYAFSGVSTDAKPLIAADDMLSALTTATAGAATVADYITAIDDWFDAPPGGGGFLDVAYGGSDTPLAAFRISPDEEAQVVITAADQPIRDTLKGLAAAALITQGGFSTDVDDRRQLAEYAGTTILGADTALIGIRADLGTVEAAIAGAQTRNSAERAALEIARVDQIGVDPFDTATALQAVTDQMESLYTITARVSRLNFTDFI